jgi:pimeloyl-ACP methyl ester carboxylesterase
MPKSSNGFLATRLETLIVHGLPTKAFSMDFEDTGGPIFPHTVLVFIPGNPGLVDWYLRSFETILARLGPGFAARGVSNAGHAFENGLSAVATTDDKNDDDATKATAIAHTVDGQSIHKCAYVDLLTVEFEVWRTSTQTETVGRPPLPTWIFVSHSIGCHVIQRALMLRPDVIRRTRLLIHLTPFLRMSAPAPEQRLFDWAASNGPTVIAGITSLLKIFKQLPRSLLNEMLKPAIGDASSREITVSLIRQPRMAANYVHLGTQEIRDVPQLFDVRSSCGNACVATLYNRRRRLLRTYLTGLFFNYKAAFCHEVHRQVLSHEHSRGR